MRGFVFVSGLLVVGIAAFVLVNVASSSGPSPSYQAAMEAQRLETAARMCHLKVVFWYVLAGITLLGLAGLAVAAVRATWSRSGWIRPDDRGLYPVVRGQVGRQTYYHDPNRQLAGAVAYTAGRDGLKIQQMLPAGAEHEQLRVTTQAQAAQVVAAAGRSQEMRPNARRLVERMTEPQPGPPRLPEVVTELDGSERHLLEAIRQDWDD